MTKTRANKDIKQENSLDPFLRKIKNLSRRMLGYPVCVSNSLSEEIYPFLHFVLNNLGDPFSNSRYQVNSFQYERRLVKFFSKLFHLAEGWGYVTSGGSEGNFQGLFQAKKLYPDGVVYTSEKSHYSVFKSIDFSGLDYRVIKVKQNGSINIDDFSCILDKTRPAIILANAGTTMTGAIDDIPRIISLLTHFTYYLHVDAALSGLLLPFLAAPPFDFTLPIHSLSVSLHKMLGVPIPSGLFLTRRNLIKADDIEYVNTKNLTLFGSRSGLAVLCAFLLLKHFKKTGLRERALYCIDLVSYLQAKFNERGISNWGNPYSNIVLFPKPSEKILKKYQLASEGNLAHIVCMPHVTRSILDEFIDLYDSN